MIAQRLVVCGLLLCWSQAASAEVMDKVPSAIELWLFSSGAFIVAVLLAFTFHPLAAFAAYPLSLFLTWLILDLLRGDLGSAVFSEAGWPFFIQGYAMVALGIVGPAIVYLIAKKWRLS
jgi:hypothetical protein